MNFINSISIIIFNEPRVYLLFVGLFVISFNFFINKRWFKGIFFYLIGCFWFLIYDFTFGFISNLGIDSFQETRSFDNDEAIFYLETIFSQIDLSTKFTFYQLKKFVLYNIISVFIFSIIYFTFYILFINLKKNLINTFGIIIIFSTLLFNFWGSINLYNKNSKIFLNQKDKFNHSPPKVIVKKENNIFLYIGESSSIMNMGIYGYPRNTTPEIDKWEKKDGFIKLKNIFSTHTLTSASLLEALSIGLNESEKILPIYQRQRISIVDILNTANIETKLFSNQGQTGSYNQTSSIIFKNAKKKFSTDSKYLGNEADFLFKKPWDHEFFKNNVKFRELDKKKGNSFIVFHSYAGHGPYIKNIPPKFHKKVDTFYNNLSNLAITGNKKSISQIEEYDSAIKYIDFSISKALKEIENLKNPWIFIYFSDHGESVFTNNAHDSSRFLHEMARVPLYIFFNNAAIKSNPELFIKYKEFQKRNIIFTLSQIPLKIFELIGVTFENQEIKNLKIETSIEASPIVIREISEGITAINLSNKKLNYRLIDQTDNATKHYIKSKLDNNSTPNICYQRSNTLAKVLRGFMVTNCLEIDVIIDKINNGTLVYHPPKRNNTNLTLKKIIETTKKIDNKTFWLDTKNLNTFKNCNIFSSNINLLNLEDTNILIELPSNTHQVDENFNKCIQKLKIKNNFYISYYVPTELAIECSKELSLGKLFKNIQKCSSLKSIFKNLSKSTMFTDISFDFRGILAIEKLFNMGFIKNMYWNTWHIEIDNLNDYDFSKFRLIIPKNNDPNNL